MSKLVVNTITNEAETVTIPTTSILTTSSTTGINASALSTGTVPTARLGSGTANSSTFLRGDGTWNTPASNLVFLSSVTANNTATTMNFTTGFDNSTYIGYMLYISKLQPSTSGRIFAIRTSSNGGSSFDSGVGDYSFTFDYVSGGGAGSNYTSGSGSFTQMGPGISVAGNSPGLSGFIYFYNLGDTTKNQVWGGTLHACLNSGNGTDATIEFTGTRLATTAINGIQILNTTVNIASGNARLYGIRAS